MHIKLLTEMRTMGFISWIGAAVLLPVHGSARECYAYYTRVDLGAEFESRSRADDHADVVVKLDAPEGRPAFWQGTSYLPLWKQGVSGTALEVDGYRTVVSLPAAQAPKIEGGNLTLEGWFALGAYPWNWAPIVRQGDDDGYFPGVDGHGYPAFMAKVGGKWQQLGVPSQPPYGDGNHLALFRWYHYAVGAADVERVFRAHGAADAQRK